jgi:NAD-dependent deacetylase
MTPVHDVSRLNLGDDPHVAVLTGAGVSAESGVPTFRGKDGLWKNHRAEDLATPEAFARDPALVWEWYDWRRQVCAAAEPNAAHAAIAELDGRLSRFLLVTQNVDGLHARAGAKRIVELHGNIFRARCMQCGAVRSDLRVPLDGIPPGCVCGGILRPDVVWFGERLPEAALREAFEVSRSCEVMLVVGTSAVVQPAASMPLLAKQAGRAVIEINPAETPITPFVDMHLEGKAAEILPEVVTHLLSPADR